MTDQVDVEALRAALEKATPGPWEAEDDSIGAEAFWIVDCHTNEPEQDPDQGKRNAELIVLLRNNAEALLNELEKAEARASTCNGRHWVDVEDSDEW